MSEGLHQQIRHMLEEVDTLAPPHDLPAAGQVWSRLKFRLAYHPRRESFASHASIVLIAVYLFVFLMWITWWKWLSASLVVVLMFAAAAAIFLCLHISQEFGS